MKKLVVDIETVGEDFSLLDDYSQQSLLKAIKKNSSSDEDYQKGLEEVKNSLGLSPLTGQVVALGMLDLDSEKGAVMYQAPSGPATESQENGIKFQIMSEAEMLKKFWQIVNQCHEVITFNGRGFDAPFLIIRSAINKIRPTQDLMHYKYSTEQKFGVTHIDLMAQLKFNGETFFKNMNLHLVCRAFGIKSPKSDGISGNDVGQLFKDKKYLQIAKYNVGDLLATAALYKYWQEYMRPPVHQNTMSY